MDVAQPKSKPATRRAGPSFLDGIAEKLVQFRADSFLCDTVLLAHDGSLPAHSVVLCAASPVLRAAIASDQGTAVHHVSVPDIGVALLEAALDVMYTGRFRLPAELMSVARFTDLVQFLSNIGVRLGAMNQSEVEFKTPPAAKPSPGSFPAAAETPIVIQTIKAEPSDTSGAQLVSVLCFPPSSVAVKTTPIPTEPTLGQSYRANKPNPENSSSANAPLPRYGSNFENGINPEIISRVKSELDAGNKSSTEHLSSSRNSSAPLNKLHSGNASKPVVNPASVLKSSSSSIAALKRSGSSKYPPLHSALRWIDIDAGSSAANNKSARICAEAASFGARLAEAAAATEAATEAAEAEAVVMAAEAVEAEKARIFTEHPFSFESLESLQSLRGKLDELYEDELDEAEQKKTSDFLYRRAKASGKRKRNVAPVADAGLVYRVSVDSVARKSVRSILTRACSSGRSVLKLPGKEAVRKNATRAKPMLTLDSSGNPFIQTSRRDDGGSKSSESVLQQPQEEQDFAEEVNSVEEDGNLLQLYDSTVESCLVKTDKSLISEECDSLVRPAAGMCTDATKREALAAEARRKGMFSIVPSGEHLTVRLIGQRARGFWNAVQKKNHKKPRKPSKLENLKPDLSGLEYSNAVEETELGANRTVRFRMPMGRLHKGNFVCERCGFRTQSSVALAGHKFRYAGGFDCAEKRAFKCRVCPAAFTHRRNWVRHERLHLDGWVPAPEDIGRSGRVRGLKMHPCAECDGKLFVDLRKHVKQAHRPGGRVVSDRPMCDKCGLTYSSVGALQNHRALMACAADDSGPGVLFSCSWCHRTFATRVARQVHSIRHIGLARIGCDVCGKRFSNPEDLRRHMTVGHGGPAAERHLCTVCGKTTSSAQALRLHLASHTGERPFECAQCDKRFLSTVTLTKHQRVHSDARPYACEICPKSYKSPMPLREHYSKHHQGESELSTLATPEGWQGGGDEGVAVEGAVDSAEEGLVEQELGDAGWQAMDMEGVIDGGMLMEGCVELEDAS